MRVEILVFDVDGVLVDVSESYREAIRRTFRHFTGTDVSRERIQDLKNQGGWNNDWDVCHRLISLEGFHVAYEDVVTRLNGILLGHNGRAGLMSRERWIARSGLLEHLAARYQLALFTGRTGEELRITLDRFAPRCPFDPMVVSDGVIKPKPAPDGLLRIAELHPGRKLWYVGDGVDDARSARAAGVSFLGIASPSNPRYEALSLLLKAEGALWVLPDINQLDQVPWHENCQAEPRA
jgi:HAD superfamily hydrolase (TIGR01548 family)